uniref:Uncharacterized protein n=1 Tax=Tetraselmis sp. GSL018 TaxID=582737 RepID=A0A061S6D9_9CHLO
MLPSSAGTMAVISSLPEPPKYASWCGSISCSPFQRLMSILPRNASVLPESSCPRVLPALRGSTRSVLLVVPATHNRAPPAECTAARAMSSLSPLRMPTECKVPFPWNLATNASGCRISSTLECVKLLGDSPARSSTTLGLAAVPRTTQWNQLWSPFPIAFLVQSLHKGAEKNEERDKGYEVDEGEGKGIEGWARRERRMDIAREGNGDGKRRPIVNGADDGSGVKRQ